MESYKAGFDGKRHFIAAIINGSCQPIENWKITGTLVGLTVLVTLCFFLPGTGFP